jgi:hypothetical protein
MNEPILLNAFPKAGTHYLAQLLQPLAAPNRATTGGIAGHTHQGWGRDRRPAESVLLDLSQVQDGERTIAHLPADPRYAKFLYERGWGMIFLYRDLRDVAVSQASHLPSLRAHPFGERLIGLPFEQRLAEIITGFADAPGGDWYPSLQRRWAEYAGWREWGWILPIRFEQAIEDRRGTCEAICDYLRRRTGRHWDNNVVRAMERAHKPRQSPTFRDGRPGAWREQLTGAARTAAKRELGPILVDLGYEQSLDW